MADILKVTTPLVSKSHAAEVKRNVDLATQFPLQDVAHVTKPSSQSELLEQNNGMVQQEEASALLLNLLKDPSVTVNFLNNISAMEAVIKLLPANNSPFTREIEQLFERLLIAPEEIAPELMRQEAAATFFKGPLFEFLRETLGRNRGQTRLQEASVNFLKAVTLFLTREEALGSVANSLRYLAANLSSSRALSQELSALSQKFQEPGAQESFRELRRETLELLQKVEDSILFSPNMDKVARMAAYNLSRFNDNGDFLSEAVSRLLDQLHGDGMREEFLRRLERFMTQARQPPKRRKSSVMEALTQILKRQSESQEVMALNSDKMEKIIHSLLSSPSNFTPLLHFVIPVQYEGLQSFAEIWINPNGEEDSRQRPADGERTIHLLLVFEIAGIGRFEMELFCRDKVLDFSLYCPPAYTSAYARMEGELKSCVGGTGYRFGEIRVERLERPRSLMDVFRSLPYKRTGVDVKV